MNGHQRSTPTARQEAAARQGCPYPAALLSVGTREPRESDGTLRREEEEAGKLGQEGLHRTPPGRSHGAASAPPSHLCTCLQDGHPPPASLLGSCLLSGAASPEQLGDSTSTPRDRVSAPAPPTSPRPRLQKAGPSLEKRDRLLLGPPGLAVVRAWPVAWL